MATPAQDAYRAAAADGVKKVTSDGEHVERHDLDELRRAADRERQEQAAAGSRRMGLRVMNVRMGGSAPM